MSKDRIKIIEETINYLKFYQDHYNYPIYKKELGKKIDDRSAFTENYSKHLEEKSIVNKETKPELLNDGNITVRESADMTIPLIQESWVNCDTMDSFANEIKDCPKCKVLVRTRKQVVFGTGNPNAGLVVVGEAPGADEDIQGKPFVGRAGKLLTDILKAINLTREEVFICNILKCRPPENRNPLPDEIANCEPYLFKQLAMIKPKLILAVGTFAAQTLLCTKEPLGKLRGKFHECKGIKTMVTYHPAALLRNPNWKRPTWEDVQLLRKEYDRLVSA